MREKKVKHIKIMKANLRNRLNVLSFILVLLLFSQNVFALTGKEIMKKNDDLPDGESSIREAVLLVIKGKRSEKKVFRLISKKYGEKKRKRITFSYPTHIEFLVWDEPGKDNLLWIKLSSGKVRKIATSNKDKPWMNSHFYNDDIGERYFNDYNYKLVGEVDIDGTTCYKIERTKTKGTWVYSKAVAYVGKDDFFARRVDLFEKGIHTKTLHFRNIEKISGIYTPRKTVMERTDGKGKSIMYIKSIEYNVPVPDEKLKREGF
jgi:hypothetical protein